MPVYALGPHQPRLPAPDRIWIAPDAHVIGHVDLGSDVGVWFGAVIRGDREAIVIGACTNIQDGAVLHTDMGFPMSIGQNCTIGHRAILHGCTIGDNTLIGMGATIMNGAQIGANSIVGANALVTEDRQFLDNSLIVGAPARAVRQLDAAAVDQLGVSARSYVENWRRFAVDLRRID